MKIATLLVAAVLSLATAHARPLTTSDKVGACVDFATVAGTIMKQRQDHDNMPDMLTILDQVMKQDDIDALDYPVYVTYVSLAYEEPRYTSQAARDKAVADFRNRRTITCLDALNEIE